MVRPILLASFAAILPVGALAQGRATMAAIPHSMAAPPRVAHYMAPPAVSQARPLARIVVRRTAPRLRTTASPTARVARRPSGRRHTVVIASQPRPGCGSVPGLGFDVPHLAAVCGPAAVGAGLSGNQLPLFFPSFGGGFFLPSSPEVVEEAGAPEAPEEENAETQVAERRRRARVMQPAPAPPSVVEASAAPRQTEECVFVRRDGTVFFAVAYAWENGTLRYVTSEGLRRSVARETLDLNATQQFNEQRGLSFRLPA